MMAAKTITRWYGKLFNRRMMERLQSGKETRLHKRNLLVSLVGRKSGKLYTFPVNYCITPDGTYVISTEANWRHNFSQGGKVDLLVGGEPISGFGRIITDDPDKRQRLGRMLAGISWPLFSSSLTVIEITSV
jgi:hypothetical protein